MSTDRPSRCRARTSVESKWVPTIPEAPAMSTTFPASPDNDTDFSARSLSSMRIWSLTTDESLQPQFDLAGRKTADLVVIDGPAVIREERARYSDGRELQRPPLHRRQDLRRERALVERLDDDDPPRRTVLTQRERVERHNRRVV